MTLASDAPQPIHPASAIDALDPRTTAEAVLYEIRRVIVGQDEMLERVLVALLAGGHLLLEGVPGLAKTLTIRTLADALDASFRRIQFTPDLVPADLVGTRMYRPNTATFETELGPVFCNFLLADEINRAPAKVQSALLEVMQERQVTIGRETFAVPKPFLVMATQNPIESEGTYPLPEAQVDRFMMKVVVGYPTAAEEQVVVERSLRPAQPVRRVLDAAQLELLQAAVPEIYVDPVLVAVRGLDRGRDPRARARRPGRPREVHLVRRQPARLDQPHPRGPGARRSCAAAGTSSPPTSTSWRRTSCATASSRPSRPSPRRSPPTRSSPASCRPCRRRARSRRSGRHDARHAGTGRLAGPHPHAGPPRPRARRPRRCSARSSCRSRARSAASSPGTTGRATSAAARSSPRSGRTSRATTSGGSTGTSPPGCRSRTSGSTSRSGRSPRGSCSTARRRCSSAPPTAARPTSPRACRSRWPISPSQRGNRLGVVTFGGAVDRTVPPRTGRAALLATLLDAELDGAAEAAGDARSVPRRPAAPRRARTPEAALRFVARGTPPGGQVVLVTDLRGPLDWLPQLGAVAQRHAVLVVEVRDPREDELPDVGELTLVDAETGREVRVDTGSSHPPHEVRRGRRPRSRPRRERAAPPPRPPRRPVHVRRLAALVRRPAPHPGIAAMTFAEPLLLAGLLLVPLALGAYLLVQRRRSRYVVRFTNVDLLTNLVPRTPGLAPARADRPVPRRDAVLVVALARPSMTLQVPREEATVMLTMDVSRSMLATDVDPTRLAAAKAAATGFVDSLPAAFRIGLVAFSTDARLVVPAHDRPRPGAGRHRQPRRRRRHGAGRRDRAVASRPPPTPAASPRIPTPVPPTRRPRRPPRPRRAPTRAPRTGPDASADPGAGDGTPVAATCSCPTAPTRPARPSRSTRPPGGRGRGHAGLHHRPRHARRRGRGPGPVRADAAAQRPARHGDPAADRRDDRRPLLRGPDGGGPRGRSTRASARRSATPSRCRRSPSGSPPGALLLVLVGGGLAALWFNRFP